MQLKYVSVKFFWLKQQQKENAGIHHNYSGQKSDNLLLVCL